MTNEDQLAAVTLLLLQRGCPVLLLDEAWSIMSVQPVPHKPGELINQIDAAIARAKD